MLAKLTALLKGGVDPKWMIVLVGIVDIQKGIGAGAVSLTNMVPDSWIPHVIAWNTGLAWIGLQLVGILAALSSSASGPLIPNISLPSIDATKAVAKVLIAAFVLSLFLASGQSAHAQRLRPFAATGDLKKDLHTDAENLGIIKPADPSAPAITTDQPCDITILTKLTPANLVPTIKKCGSNDVQVLVDGTQSALDSAKAFTPNPDQDGINCLTPALALFKAGVQTPAVPEVPAVLNADGSVKTAAVPAVPAKDPNPILLFQKYREFTLAGGLTSCQSYIKTPVNATIAAGGQIVGDGLAIGAAAAAIAPK